MDNVEAVTAVSAYIYRRNYDLFEAIGTEPFINLGCNGKGKSHGSFAWRRIVYDYQRNPEGWTRVYRFRRSA
jgi:hypothetical protein